MEFRPITPADLGDLLALNESFVPHVGTTDRERLGWLVDHACWARTTPGRDAFLIALPPGTDYWSPNYAWVAARWTRFAYIDRVAVAGHLHGTGVGRALYEALFADLAAAGVDRGTCEVNTRPPNPGSIAFHHRMGFTRVGVRGDAKGTVAMMARRLP
ncbi:MAG: GNAT family N-acetyltransferase [Thermoleophilia bacterium]